MTHTPEFESVRHRGLGRWRLVLWGGLGGLLLLPLVAMRFTTEVDWSPFDFIVMGSLFVMVGGAFELAARASGSLTYRIGAGVAIVTAFLLIWVNLAVGFIGDEDNPDNLLFLAIAAAGLIGAVLSRFRAGGLRWTLAAMGAIQLAIGVIAHTRGDLIWPQTLAFALLWLFAAALFHVAEPMRSRSAT